MVNQLNTPERGLLDTVVWLSLKRPCENGSKNCEEQCAGSFLSDAATFPAHLF
jgi:hypothetical protein